VVEGIIGAKDVRKAFGGLDLGRQRTIVDALLIVTVNPAATNTGRRLDTSLIDLGVEGRPVIGVAAPLPVEIINTTQWWVQWLPLAGPAFVAIGVLVGVILCNRTNQEWAMKATRCRAISW